MKSSLALIVLFTSILVSISTLLTSVARADFPQGKNALLADFGVSPGGVALGIDFENGYSHTFGVGAYFRLNPDDQSNHDTGYTALGVFIRPHFNRQQWDLYASPGFGLVFIKPTDNSSSKTVLGPSWAIGLLYEFNPQVSFGCETMTLVSWTGSAPYRGDLQTDFTAKFRFIF